MTVLNPDDSVRKEQFDAENKSAETNREKGLENESRETPEDTENTESKIPAENTGDEKRTEDAGDVRDDSSGNEPPPHDAQVKDENRDVTGEKPDTEEKEATEKEPGTEIKDDTEEKEATEKEPGTEVKDDTEEKEATEKETGTEVNKDTEEKEATRDDEKSEDDPGKYEVKGEPEELAEVDYSGRSKEELIETLELLIENRPLKEISDDVNKIKTIFYKKYKAETEEKKKTFIDEGGRKEDFDPGKDPLEIKMKNLLARYRGKRTEFNKQLEIEKQENLKRKYEIIDKIKDLVNREESINKTFQEFRDLQSKFHSIGMVPQSALRNMWETYNLNVEIFYDYIKINKELRDLDFKKNIEKKTSLCEKAEGLMDDPSPVNAFRILQEYHQQWRETGPVPREIRSEMWERFKTATSKINKRHHEYFENLKEDQKKNLADKTLLCEKVEEINKLEINSFKEWEKKGKEVIGIQKEWRTIGFAPKKHNNSIYQRFRKACDEFFQAKRKFFAENKELQMENLQKKTELCEQAEELQDSTDWKEATSALIQLQKDWKEIGSVPRKYSDKVWKRFRKACDHFFNRKSDHFADLSSSYDDNLREKEALISELEEFDPGEDTEEAAQKLKDIQERWSAIGFVPYKDKDRILNSYRNALNKQFDKLKMDEEDKAILKYQTKLDNIKEKPRGDRKLKGDREKFINKIKQLENDIVVWENNIGFFSKSSNAETLIAEVQDKIDNARKTIEILEEKINLIDQSGIDDN